MNISNGLLLNIGEVGCALVAIIALYYEFIYKHTRSLRRHARARGHRRRR